MAHVTVGAYTPIPFHGIIAAPKYFSAANCEPWLYYDNVQTNMIVSSWRT